VDRLVVHVNGLKVLPTIARHASSEPAAPAGPPASAQAGDAADDVVPLTTLARRRTALRRCADGRSR
jgi:hypothetical protein